MKQTLIGALFVCFLMAFAAVAGAETEGFGKMTVLYTEYPPFTYTEDGKAAGFAIDLLRAMFREAGVQAQMRTLPWKRAETMLNHDKNTMVFCARIERREDLYEWIGPVYPRKISLYKLKSRSDIKINGLEDVMRYKIGVVRGYASVTDLLKIGIPDENLERTVDETLNIRKLYGNRFDLIPNNDMVFSYNLQKAGRGLGDMEKVFDVTQAGVSDYYYAINRETDPALVEKLRQAFDRIKENKTYDAVLKQYIR